MKSTINVALEDQTEVKKLASTCSEDGIKTIHGIDLVFNVLVQTKTKQLIAYLDKLCLVFGANNAVKLGVLIEDADQYRLSSDDTTFDNFEVKGGENLGIQSSDYFVEIDGEACFQGIPLVGLNGASRPSKVMCAKKYRCKFALNSQIERRFKYPAIARLFCSGLLCGFVMFAPAFAVALGWVGD